MTHARIVPGCRRLTEAHIQVQAMAERFEGLPDGVSKGQVLSAFKQATQPLGISPRLRDAVDVLFAFSQPQDWEEGSQPVVWPSNRKLESALCLGRRQVQNILNSLIHLRLITPIDSPTVSAGDSVTPRAVGSERPTALISLRLACATKSLLTRRSAHPRRSVSGWSCGEG